MKKILAASFLSAIFCGGGVNSLYAAVNDELTGEPSTEVTAGDDTNQATFSWSGTTLTVTGKGDLSKVTVTDNNTKVFSATGAGKVYTKSGNNTISVKQGDKYDATNSYYEADFTYEQKFDGASAPTTIQNVYTVANKYVSHVEEGKAIYSYYFSQRYDHSSSQNVTTIIITKNAVTFKDNGDVYAGGTYVSDWNGTYTQEGKTLYKYLVVNENIENTTIDYDKVEENGITILTPENRSTYVSSVVTVTPSIANLFSKASGSDSYTARTSAWQWSEGESIYTGTATVKDEAIADNDTYFGTTHTAYLTDAVLSFVDYLPIVVTSDIKTVVFKTDADVKTDDDNSKKANINNEITRALVKIKSIETLNLQDTYLAKINAHNPTLKGDAPDYKVLEDPTFYLGTLGTYEVPVNSTLKTLYMPTTDTKELARENCGEGGSFTVFQFLTGLKELHLGEGIETIGEYSMVTYTGSETVDGSYVQRKFILSSITFPNSLKKILKNSFDGQTDILTFTFPAHLEYIQEGAFTSANPRDVYFLGLEAPKVDANAWGDNSYISNNSLNPLATTTLSDGATTGIEVSLEKGVATRSTYYTGNNGWMTMLHYPANCSKAQAAKYTDQTRTYVKIDYGKETELVKSTTDAQGVTTYNYAAGKETEELKGKTSSTSSQAAVKIFINRYSSGTFTGGDYTGGYNDIFVGGQYIWPSMGMAYRATVVAQNNKLWDGITSIADGIKNRLAGDESYDGDGTEFIGLHQFVFAQGDVTTDKTDEWDVTKYADGKWHSICLPFDVTKAKMKETFGPTSKDDDGNEVYNIRVCKFHQVDRTDDKLKLYFNEEHFENATDDEVVLKAHVSYMIMAKKENMVKDEKVVIKNYVMAAGTPLPTNVTANAKTGGSEGATEEGQYYFVGNYASGINIPQYSYFFSKSKGYFRFQAGTTAKWNGYTSVVEAPNGAEDYTKYFNGSSTENDAKLATVWDDSETTDIDKVTIEIDNEIVYTNDNVYNLNGQLVSTRGLNGLSKGIYIQNGKKYIVK